MPSSASASTPVALSRRLAFLGLGAAVIAWGALLSGAPFLAVELPGGLPLGNLLAWLAIATPVLLASTGSATSRPPQRVAVRFERIAQSLAVAWLPVSTLLAGNLHLNFDPARFRLWIGFTILVAFTGAASVVVRGMAIVSHRRRAARR